MDRISNMIGQLVVNGYMASYHEGAVYLHTSQGKRWAMIEPFGMSMTFTRINDDGKVLYAGANGIENASDLLTVIRDAEAVA